MSVTHSQCNARPTVILPFARHHHPLAGTKLYSLVTEARVCSSVAEWFGSCTCIQQVAGFESYPPLSRATLGKLCGKPK